MTSSLTTRPDGCGAVSARGGRVAVVVSGFPRLSETFAVNELLALQRAGRLACVLATKPGDHGTVVSGCDQPGWGLLEPLTTVLSGDDAEQAEQAAEIVRATGGVDLVHGYFAHRPAAIAELTAATLGVPFSFSVHALDVRKVEPVELQRRAANARTVITCNADALATLRDLDIDAQLVPHGVDLDRFHPPASHREPGPSLRLLSVGRLVEKKGFRFLIEAMAAVDDRVRLEIVGDGPERSHLEQMIDDLELGDRVALVGRRSHDELPQLYRDADVVVVPSVIDSTGDRDGLPNVVLEALASGRPIVASDVAAIAVAVRDGAGDDANGLLVEPANVAELGRALIELSERPAVLRQLGRSARRTAVERYDVLECSTRFCRALEAQHV